MQCPLLVLTGPICGPNPSLGPNPVLIANVAAEFILIDNVTHLLQYFFSRRVRRAYPGL